MTSLINEKVFLDANQKAVEYDGSPITWRVSAYVLIKKEDMVLLIKDKREKLYDVVGGGIEFGETIEETLYREAMEESGAEIKIGKLLHTNVSWFYHTANKQFHQTLRLFYQAELVTELKEPTEENIDWVGFVPISEIGKQHKLPGVVEKIILDHLV